MIDWLIDWLLSLYYVLQGRGPVHLSVESLQLGFILRWRLVTYYPETCGSCCKPIAGLNSKTSGLHNRRLRLHSLLTRASPCLIQECILWLPRIPSGASKPCERLSLRPPSSPAAAALALLMICYLAPLMGIVQIPRRSSFKAPTTLQTHGVQHRLKHIVANSAFFPFTVVVGLELNATQKPKPPGQVGAWGWLRVLQWSSALLYSVIWRQFWDETSVMKAGKSTSTIPAFLTARALADTSSLSE